MRNLKWLSILTLALIQLSCGSDENNGASPEEVSAAMLSGSWTMGAGSSITRDGVDQTPDYANFVIRFTTSSQYVIQGDPNNVIFPTGTWKFVEGDLTKILLNKSEVPISIQYEGDNVLILTFTISGDIPIGSRTNGVSGEYVLRLVR